MSRPVPAMARPSMVAWVVKTVPRCQFFERQQTRAASIHGTEATLHTLPWAPRSFVNGSNHRTAGRNFKHDRLNIISRQSESTPWPLPQIVQQLDLLRIALSKIDKNHLRPAGDIPAAHTAQVPGGKGHFKGIPHAFVGFFKSRGFVKKNGQEESNPRQTALRSLQGLAVATE